MSSEAVIAQAERWLGTGEPNEIQAWYRQRNGADYSGNFAWCDAGVTRWSADAGEWDAVCLGRDRAYTPEHAQAFLSAGRWTYGTSGIQRGDIVFFDWEMPAPGAGRIMNIDHVGIVTDVLPGSRVATIEANTADVCARRVRGPEVIVGYGRPAYTQAAQPQQPTAPAATPTPSAPAWPGRYLKLKSPRMQGPDVRQMQQQLRNRRWNLGTSGPSGDGVDGDYGPATDRAVRAFQQECVREAFGIGASGADGVVGPLTWRAFWLKPRT
ncbi:peptidoglycan-binding protein [Kitasatospora cineracea]|uniref:peptidoglycan-binding protein n=1 Tax=Kitasatospora cineracea TaxID=88074 RepID=UPI0034340F95